jgi:hypothetical protein
MLYQIIDSYQTKPNKGVPIGNLTSQYFANFYLSAADRYASEQLKLKYIRYMDDMLFFANDRKVLKEKTLLLQQCIAEKLKLQLKPPIIKPVSFGVPFLGFRIYPEKTKLNRASKQRFYRKIKSYYKYLRMGKWSQHDFQIHALPLMAFIQHADTQQMRKNIIFTLEGQMSEVRTV